MLSALYPKAKDFGEAVEVLSSMYRKTIQSTKGEIHHEGIMGKLQDVLREDEMSLTETEVTDFDTELEYHASSFGVRSMVCQSFTSKNSCWSE